MAFVKKDEVTNELVSEWLNSAAIETSIDEDGDVYAKRGGIDFGLWVKINSDRGYIRLLTYMKCKEGVDIDALDAFASRLNSNYVFVRFTTTVSDNGQAYLYGDYDLLYTFGVSVENFVATVRKFSAVFVDAIRSEDEDDVFFG